MWRGTGSHSARKRIRLGFSVNELSDSAAHGDQERALSSSAERLYPVRFIGHRIELREPRLPSPQPVQAPAQRLPRCPHTDEHSCGPKLPSSP